MVIIETPKRHILGRNRTYMPNLVQIGPLVRPGRVLKESKEKRKPKKGEERNLQWQTGCLPRPPTLTQRYVVVHAGWFLGGSSKFQVSSKSVERFSRSGGGVEICHFLYLRPVAYVTACTTVQAVIAVCCMLISILCRSLTLQNKTRSLAEVYTHSLTYLFSRLCCYVAFS